MKYISRFVFAVLSIVLFSVVAHSQIRQTKLYIDDGSGHFTVLQGASGGGALTFPTGGGMIQSSGGKVVVSTETDTAKAADTVMLSGTTACATIVSNGATSDVTAHIASATSGQVLYLFNKLGTTHNVYFSGFGVGAGNVMVFIYLAGGWQQITPPATI